MTLANSLSCFVIQENMMLRKLSIISNCLWGINLGRKSKQSQQIDLGGEYRFGGENMMLLSIISHCLIFPHTHQQKGFIERKYRHIIEIGPSLMAHAS